MRTSKETLSILLLVVITLFGCPEEETPDGDDDDTTAMADDDASGLYVYAGEVRTSSEYEPVEGLWVEVGEVQTETDEAGIYVVELEEGPPQQVSFIDGDLEADTYLDCDLEHDHTVYDSVLGDGPDTATVELTFLGLNDPDGFWGQWSSLKTSSSGSSSYSYHFSGSALEERVPGEYGVDLPVYCLDSWLAAAGEESSGALISLAWEEGDSCVAGGTIEVTLVLEDPGQDSFTWDGVVDADVESVGFYQYLELANTSLSVGLWDGAPVGDEVVIPLVMGDESTASVAVSSRFEEVSGCDSAYSGETLAELVPGDTVSLGPLLDPVPLESTKGQDEWGPRPDLTLENLPAEAESYTGRLYSYSYDPDYEKQLSWYFYGDHACPSETVTYPDGLIDAVPDAEASAALAYYVGDRYASCYRYFTWPGVAK